jgi:hydroxymethylpyrimidine pyrophosphatase-like HAD family hydrolase
MKQSSRLFGDRLSHMKIIMTNLDKTILQDNRILPYCLDVIIGIVIARPYYSTITFTQLINPSVLIASIEYWVYVNSVVLQGLLPGESDCGHILFFFENTGLGEQTIIKDREQYYCTFKKCKEWAEYKNAILFDCCNFRVLCSYKTTLPINKKSIALKQSKTMNNYGVAAYNDLKLLRITRRNTTRLSDVQFVLSYIGTSFSCVIFFYDDGCDILKYSGLRIAVKNATNNLKKQTNFICDPIVEDGVQKLIYSKPLQRSL